MSQPNVMSFHPPPKPPVEEKAPRKAAATSLIAPEPAYVPPKPELQVNILKPTSIPRHVSKPVLEVSDLLSVSLPQLVKPPPPKPALQIEIIESVSVTPARTFGMQQMGRE